MATTVTSKAFRNLSKHAEAIKNDEHQVAGSMSPGDAWAQGDILIVALGEVPVGSVLAKNPSAQLAPGNTQGSRHCLDSLEGIQILEQRGNPLDGPIIVSDREFAVTHPEHGDVTFQAGVYAVVYQRAFAEELRRVQD